jgi:hypothetical protein
MNNNNEEQIDARRDTAPAVAMFFFPIKQSHTLDKTLTYSVYDHILSYLLIIVYVNVHFVNKLCKPPRIAITCVRG